MKGQWTNIYSGDLPLRSWWVDSVNESKYVSIVLPEVFGINKDKEPAEALKISNTVLIALLKGNNLDLKSILEKDGLIKKNIKKEATYRINFCREETKKAIPKLIKKLPEGVVLGEERIENLTRVFPLQYLSMFEQFSKSKK